MSFLHCQRRPAKKEQLRPKRTWPKRLSSDERRTAFPAKEAVMAVRGGQATQRLPPERLQKPVSDEPIQYLWCASLRLSDQLHECCEIVAPI